MATIFERNNKDGSITYRVFFRRKGVKPFITSFISYDEAKSFVDKYEELYCLNPNDFDWDKLKHIRQNEFQRKKIKVKENKKTVVKLAEELTIKYS